MKLDTIVAWIDLYPSGEEPVTGTLETFLTRLTDLQPKQRVPPYAVLVQILERHITGGGMEGGLAWPDTEIQLDSRGYFDFASRQANREFFGNCEVSTVEEWIALCSERDYGIDYSEHLVLLNELRRTEIADAQDSNEQTQAACRDATEKYFDFMSTCAGAP